jgi:hypothetical protein
MATKTKGKQLVIDASVARSSCDSPDAEYPIDVHRRTPFHCRDFLGAVLKSCHQVVMTPDIREEWNRHKSRYSHKWRKKMMDKRRLLFKPEPDRNKKLWDFLEKMAKTDREHHEITKDICLLEAALASDRIIISLDENTARKYFNEAAFTFELLRSIAWLNPDKIEAEQPIAWIQADCPFEEQRLLGYRKPQAKS